MNVNMLHLIFLKYPVDKGLPNLFVMQIRAHCLSVNNLQPLTGWQYAASKLNILLCKQR